MEPVTPKQGTPPHSLQSDEVTHLLTVAFHDATKQIENPELRQRNSMVTNVSVIDQQSRIVKLQFQHGVIWYHKISQSNFELLNDTQQLGTSIVADEIANFPSYHPFSLPSQWENFKIAQTLSWGFMADKEYVNKFIGQYGVRAIIPDYDDQSQLIIYSVITDIKEAEQKINELFTKCEEYFAVYFSFKDAFSDDSPIDLTNSNDEKLNIYTLFEGYYLRDEFFRELIKQLNPNIIVEHVVK